MKKVLGLIAALAAATFAGDYSTWGFNRTVTVSTTGLGLSADVASLPILVRFRAAQQGDMLNAAGTQMLADGADIRVTEIDGITDVPFEIDSASVGSGGALFLWIYASNVLQNSSAAATFRVYWKKAGALTASDPTAVFQGSSGYQAVFHFKSAAPLADASSNAYSVITGNTTANLTAPLIGSARTFGTATGNVDNVTTTSNVYAYFNAFSGPLGTNGAMPALTLSAWTRSSLTSTGNRAGGEKHVVYHGTGQGNATGHAFLKRWGVPTNVTGGDTYPGANRWLAGGDTTYADSGTGVRGPYVGFGEAGATIDNWVFVAAVWNGANWVTYRQRRWENWNAGVGGARATPTTRPNYFGASDTAVQFDTSTVAGAPVVENTKSWFIGGWQANGVGSAATVARRLWQGQLDEVRIENVARSYDYLRLRFLAERDTIGSVNNVLYTIGSPVTAIGGRAVRLGSLASKVTSQGVTFRLSEATPGTLTILDLFGR
ncbi:MAG TPA: hypothetical protein VHO02_05445, partial [Fibrobacteria bacterium]|nr:hypothetical protein [Fibrobacteria bacterium]